MTLKIIFGSYGWIVNRYKFIIKWLVFSNYSQNKINGSMKIKMNVKYS